MERVVWIDSGLVIEDGWQNTDFYIRQAKGWDGQVTTIGGVIHEDDSVLVLGLSRDDTHDNWYCAQLIAKTNIVSRHHLADT